MNRNIKKQIKKGVPRRKPSAGAKAPKKELRLKVGGYYKNRLGKIVGPIMDAVYPFADKTGRTYSRNGQFLASNTCMEDLVREVKGKKGVSK